MQYFRRKITAKTLLNIPSFIVYFIKCLFIFKSPILFSLYYVTKVPPRNGLIELRNGYRIFLSEYPGDISTIFAIFVKQEYGAIAPNSIVIDTGAYIGAFSLYACYKGAKKVYAYEPNKGAYECLLRNISASKLENVIIPYRLAVTSDEGNVVKFPQKTSSRNKIIIGENYEDYDLVNTTSLESIFNFNSIRCVDILKLDCEGSEYDIIFNANKATFSKIKNIRLEYHNGRVEDIVSFLRKNGLKLIYHRKDNSVRGSCGFLKIE